MKFGILKSIGHNIAESLASGIGLLIGVYEMDIFGEAAAAPEGFMEVDFLTGEASGGRPSCDLAQSLKLYAEALPGLCERHGADISEFRQLTARYSSQHSRTHQLPIAHRCPLHMLLLAGGTILGG